MRPNECKPEVVCSAHGVCVQNYVTTASSTACSCNVGYAGQACTECAPGFVASGSPQTCEFPVPSSPGEAPPEVRILLRLHDLDLSTAKANADDFRADLEKVFSLALGISQDQVVVGEMSDASMGLNGMSSSEVQVTITFVPDANDTMATM